MKYYFLTKYSMVLVYRDDGDSLTVKAVGINSTQVWSHAVASREYVKSHAVRVCAAVKHLQERGRKITRAELIR